VLFGSARQLALVPASVTAERVPWPTPLLPALPGLLDAHRGRRICVLASGDPMLFGVGATLARAFPPAQLRIIPGPSSLSFAAARLGWPLQDVATVSLVGRPLATLNAHVREGTRVLILSRDGTSPLEIAALLSERGFGPTSMTVFENLGGPRECRIDARAETWRGEAVGPLNIVALECRTNGGHALPLTSGLPDGAFLNDGQLTKRDVRAVTLARLAPAPGAMLWDVGAGCGSIGIEWMRAHPACKAIAIESNPRRQAFIAHNRDALGVPALRLVEGRAPDALSGLPAPDAIFIGGGAAVPGLLDAVIAALRSGGRLVANAVTLESEAVLLARHASQGGELVRIALSRADGVGTKTGWRPAMPVTQWVWTKP